jgi:hypothetical protein
VSNLILGFNQHFACAAIVLVPSFIALLQLALDQWNEYLERARYLLRSAQRW